MKWTTKWLSFICSQSCVYVINATVTVAGSHGVAPSRPKRRKPTNDKLMTQQTTLQKIRFENGLAVAKSKIEYVMCRIEEIRLQLQGHPQFPLNPLFWNHTTQINPHIPPNLNNAHSLPTPHQPFSITSTHPILHIHTIPTINYDYNLPITD